MEDKFRQDLEAKKDGLHCRLVGSRRGGRRKSAQEAVETLKRGAALSVFGPGGGATVEKVGGQFGARHFNELRGATRLHDTPEDALNTAAALTQ